MPQISRRKMKEEVWWGVWRKFVDTVVGLDSPRKVDVFMMGLLTNTERVMLAKRLMVAVLTLSDWTPAQIADALSLSRPSVYRLRAYFVLDAEYRKLVGASFPYKIPYKDGAKPLPLLLRGLKELYRVKYPKLFGGEDL